ncbi:hypothetical protein [Streptomyces sp. cg35]|uniref:hypothetical protein n=1 Tax=Streptomyces sp. cg35 TaxID=3421650 RepID=UPI003D16769A
MSHATVRAGICAAALTGVCALSGTAVGSAQASDRTPDSWGDGWRHSAPRHESTGHDHAVPAVVTAWSEVYVRDAPTTHAEATSSLPSGAHIRLFCQTSGEHVNGTSTWYFDNDAHGWISAAHVHPTSWQPPSC